MRTTRFLPWAIAVAATLTATVSATAVTIEPDTRAEAAAVPSIAMRDASSPSRAPRHEKLDLGPASGQVADAERGGLPEPASWALMVIGVGMIGGALRGFVVANRRLAGLQPDDMGQDGASKA